MAERSVHVWITGGVQGVGYRAWCQRRAMELGLSGWVRNRATGEVEAVFSGPPAQVDTMIHDCHDGPRGARVADVTVQENAGPVAGPFEVLDTA